jgi:predicted DNA-binding transcriptional regulator YafY
MQKVIERILNLLAFLLTMDRAVTADEIRMTVAGYDQDSDDAWRRMFERDKDLLRGLGIPLETRPTDAWGVEHGYTVPHAEYALPDPGLNDEERTALWLAAKVVRIGGGASGPDALFKLGGTPLVSAGEPLAADLGTEAEELAELFVAVTEKRRAQFVYGGKQRSVHGYGLVHRRGHWYLVGPEQNDSTIKVFRVDRMVALQLEDESGSFERPEGFRAASSIPEAPWEAGPGDTEALVRFDESIAWWARRQLVGGSEVIELPDGRLEARLRVANSEAFIGWMLSFDAAAEIVAPAEFRERLLEKVRSAR